MGVDEEGRALATPEYWNTRYTTSSGPEPTHEWFRSYAALEPFFARHLFPSYPPSSNPQILHLGSGDSTVPYDLAQKGYKNQTCLDFSQVVVDLMSQRHAEVEGITWRWADVRDTREQAHDGSVDVAFDKGTLDAMIHGSPWDPPEQVREDTARYMREVHRALKPTGVFLYVTFRQPHFIKPLLNPDGGQSLWDLEMETLGGGESSFDYFAFVLRKKKPQAGS